MRSNFILAAIAFLFAACFALPALAQSDHTTDPREFPEAERRVYAQSLKEARGLIELAKYDEAIVVLDRLNAQRPREPQARFLKGLALADSGKTDAAIAVFQAVLGDFPELPEPHNNLAVLYAKKGQYGLARDELEAAIAAAPDYVVAYENLGDIYARLAAMNYEKAIARDPKNESAPAKLKLMRNVLAPTTTAASDAAANGKPSSVVTTPPPAPPAAAAKR
ncbi:MAG: tetratricopeptide repeat protein [Burkholderiales bacterium]|nr:tetratricopeptide repeat protein [Burkholderiales bacterium]